MVLWELVTASEKGTTEVVTPNPITSQGNPADEQLRFPPSPCSASPVQTAPQSAWSSSSGCECVC